MINSIAIPTGQVNTRVVFALIRAAITELENTNAVLSGIRVYVPIWFDMMMDFESIKNPVIYSTFPSSGNRLIYGHEVLPGYEDSIVVADTKKHPSSLVRISLAKD